MIVLAYLQSQVQNFTQLVGHADSLMSFYLQLCIWRDAILLWIRQRNSIQFCVNIGKQTLALIRQTFREESMCHTREVQTHWHRKKWDRWKAKSRVCLTFSLTSRWLFTKNSSWQAKQSVPHTAVTFYGDCMKMCGEDHPELWWQKTGRYITFSPGNFFTTNMTAVPHSP
jgi:hypothetical protein